MGRNCLLARFSCAKVQVSCPDYCNLINNNTNSNKNNKFVS